MDINQLLAMAVKHQASDLHLSAGLKPMIRVAGDLQPLEMQALRHEDILDILNCLTDGKKRIDLERQLDIDFAFEIQGIGRFRGNALMQQRGAAVVFRIIPSTILSFEALGLPPILKEIAAYSRGLVLVTGSSGSGKSTTLAAFLDSINRRCNKHIITIEDPIETVHVCHQCLVTQREVYRDTPSFSMGLRQALREDPDIIMLGELRDLETIRLAMTAAETGHLVLATLHTNSVTKSIHRIIDVFPGDEKSMARSMLSESLQAVVGQTLIKKIGGGRIAACEIMICNAAIRHLIREDKIAQMVSLIQTGLNQGMMTYEQHLAQLTGEQLIAPESACM